MLKVFQRLAGHGYRYARRVVVGLAESARDGPCDRLGVVAEQPRVLVELEAVAHPVGVQEDQVVRLREAGQPLKGVVDHYVPVLTVHGEDDTFPIDVAEALAQARFKGPVLPPIGEHPDVPGMVARTIHDASAIVGVDS